MKVRPIRIAGEVAYITLTKGYEAVIDVKDIPLVDGYNWTAMVRPHTVYARRNWCTDGKQKSVLMHRVILGEPKGVEVDHKDCDGLNNRRSNLRAASRLDNSHNQRLSKRNTSGFKGVSFRRRDGNWTAQILLNGRTHYLGHHPTPMAAHAAYQRASAELHGEFGRTA